MRALNILLCSLLLTGCASRDRLRDYAITPHNAPTSYFDAGIFGRDGTRVRATVLQPAFKAGENAPLVIHTRGWDGWRVTDPDGFYGTQRCPGTPHSGLGSGLLGNQL
jgi:ABC-2 type transport system ATP-binding protein